MAPHNLWLECAARGEIGKPLDCIMLYGHHFEPDGKADPSRTRLWLYAPESAPRTLDLHAGDDKLVATFTAADPGVYGLAAEYDVGVYGRLKDGTYAKGQTTGDDVSAVVHFVHYAKTFVLVGDTADLPASGGMQLEIVPQSLDREEIKLRVESGGSPLAYCEVFAHCKGRRISRFARTDGEGTVFFGISPGEWMFIVRREAPAEDEATMRVDGATLTLTVGE